MTAAAEGEAGTKERLNWETGEGVLTARGGERLAGMLRELLMSHEVNVFRQLCPNRNAAPPPRHLVLKFGWVEIRRGL